MAEQAGPCAGTDPAPPHVAEEVSRELNRLVHVIMRFKQRDDVAVASVLSHLVDTGPQRVGEIAAAVGTDPSTVSRQVTALVEAGFAERRPDPADGRAQRLVPTEAGIDRCAHSRRKRMEFVKAVLARWPEDAQQQLAQLLGRFIDDVQQWDRQDLRRPEGEI